MPRPRRRGSSRARAFDSRDFTVPSGMRSSRATALTSKPMRWCRTTTCRWGSERVARARVTSTPSPDGPATEAAGPCLEESCAAVSQLAGPIAEQAERDAAHPGFRSLVARDTMPLRHQADEGLLDDLLCLVAVACGKGDKSDQPGVGAGIQLPKPVAARHLHTPNTHEGTVRFTSRRTECTRGARAEGQGLLSRRQRQ
jgi:hypothetical protein